MPFVVSTTLAPALRIFSMRSFVMSISRCRMASTSFTSFTTTLCASSHESSELGEQDASSLWTTEIGGAKKNYFNTWLIIATHMTSIVVNFRQ